MWIVVRENGKWLCYVKVVKINFLEFLFLGFFELVLFEIDVCFLMIVVFKKYFEDERFFLFFEELLGFLIVFKINFGVLVFSLFVFGCIIFILVWV